MKGGAFLGKGTAGSVYTTNDEIFNKYTVKFTQNNNDVPKDENTVIKTNFQDQSYMLTEIAIIERLFKSVPNFQRFVPFQRNAYIVTLQNESQLVQGILMHKCRSFHDEADLEKYLTVNKGLDKQLMSFLCDYLYSLHDMNFLHLDIKPDNILYSEITKKFYIGDCDTIRSISSVIQLLESFRKPTKATLGNIRYDERLSKNLNRIVDELKQGHYPDYTIMTKMLKVLDWQTIYMLCLTVYTEYIDDFLKKMKPLLPNVIWKNIYSIKPVLSNDIGIDESILARNLEWWIKFDVKRFEKDMLEFTSSPQSGGLKKVNVTYDNRTYCVRIAADGTRYITTDRKRLYLTQIRGKYRYKK